MVLRGESRSSVARARTQTELVISSTLASSRLEYNYFVSLPLATPAVRAAMEALKQQVLAEPGAASSGGWGVRSHRGGVVWIAEAPCLGLLWPSGSEQLVSQAFSTRRGCCSAAGIEDSIFMKSAHLHLTLCMLKLYSEERRALARQVLRGSISAGRLEH